MIIRLVALLIIITAPLWGILAIAFVPDATNYSGKVKMKFKDFKPCYLIYPGRYELGFMSVYMICRKTGGYHPSEYRKKICFSLFDVFRYWTFKHEINKQRRQMEETEELRLVLATMQKDIDEYMKKEKASVEQGQKEVEDFIREQKNRQMQLRVNQQ